MSTSMSSLFKAGMSLDTLERVLTAAEAWAAMAKETIVYHDDIAEIRRWVARDDEAVVFPTLYVDAGDNTPDNIRDYPEVDPAYAGSRRHRKELHNDLMRVVYLCRAHGFDEHETACALERLLDAELHVVVSAEHLGYGPSSGETFNQHMASLNAGLRDLHERRKQRKCQHRYLPGDHLCFRCKEHKYESELSFWENLLMRAKMMADWDRPPGSPSTPEEGEE